MSRPGSWARDILLKYRRLRIGIFLGLAIVFALFAIRDSRFWILAICELGIAALAWADKFRHRNKNSSDANTKEKEQDTSE